MGVSMQMVLILVFFLQTIIGCSAPTNTLLEQNNIPEDFVDVGDYIDGVEIDARYFGTNNFTGNNVNGYLANKCYLRREAALSLKRRSIQIHCFGLYLSNSANKKII